MLRRCRLHSFAAVFCILTCCAARVAAQESSTNSYVELLQQQADMDRQLHQQQAEVRQLQQNVTALQSTIAQNAKTLNDFNKAEQLFADVQQQRDQLRQLQQRLEQQAVLNNEDRQLLQSTLGDDGTQILSTTAARLLGNLITELNQRSEALQQIVDDPQRAEKTQQLQQQLNAQQAMLAELQAKLEAADKQLAETGSELLELRRRVTVTYVDLQLAQAQAESAQVNEQLEQSRIRQRENLDIHLKVFEGHVANTLVLQPPLFPQLGADQPIVIVPEVPTPPLEITRLYPDPQLQQSLTQLDAGRANLNQLDRVLPELRIIVRAEDPPGHFQATQAGNPQLNQFVQSANDLVDAQQSLQDSTSELERALKMAEDAATRALDLQAQSKALTIPDGGRVPDPQLFTFTPQSHRYFATPEGLQRLQVIDDFAIRGDLDGLESFRELLKIERTPEQVQAELDLVRDLTDAIRVEAEELTTLIVTVKQTAGDALTPVQAADVVTRQFTLFSKLPPPEIVGLPVQPQFRAQVLEQFQAPILERVQLRIAQTNAALQPGITVIKGTAKLEGQNVPPPSAVVTMTFTLPNEEDEDVEEKTETTQPDENGNYEFKLPENAFPNELKISAPGVIDPPPIPGRILITENTDRQPDAVNPVIVHGLSNLLGQDINIEIPPQNVPPGQRPYDEVFSSGALHHRIFDDVIFRRPDQYPDAQTDPFRAITPGLVQQQFDQILNDRNQPIPPPQPPGDISIDEFILVNRPVGMAVGVEPENPISNDELEAALESALKQALGMQPDEPGLDVRHVGAIDTVDRPLSLLPELDPTVNLPPPEPIRVHFLVADSPQSLQPQINQVKPTFPGIKFFEPEFPRYGEAVSPQDPNFTSQGSWGQTYADQWALHRVGGAPDSPVWPEEISQAQECTVAVIGSGIDWTHPELAGQIWRNVGEVPANGKDDDENGYVDDVWGWNFRDGTPHVLDQGGHDTHVAGVIGAKWDTFGIAGVNPKTRIMPLKAANQLAQSDSVSISRAILYAVENGAKVINVSYGGPTPSQAEQAAINHAVSQGVLVVVAAGNKSEDAADYALAGSPGVLTVAGTTVEDKRAPFSNYGSPVDIAAPAMDVLGVRARGTDFLLYIAENPEYVGGTGFVGSERKLYRASGTSFAAPFVSGAASLLFTSNPALTHRDVARKLLASVADVEVPGVDQYTGYGLIDLRNAVQANPDDLLSVVITSVTPVRVGQKIVVQVNGRVSGARIENRQVQVAFGEQPADDEWKTIEQAFDLVESNSPLGQIPIQAFTKKGVWSIRVLATTLNGKSHEGRATINLN